MRMPGACSASAVAIAVVLSGCQSTAFDLRDVVPPRLGVITTTDVYDVPPGRCAEARRAVRSFVGSAANGRPESLRVSVEVGSSQSCRPLIVLAIRDAGVSPSHLRVLSTAAHGHAVHVRVERLVAAFADCHMSDAANRISPNDNEFDPALGCSTLVNVGSMVADPEDLFAGRGKVKGEGEPAASAVAAERRRHDVQPAAPPTQQQDHVKTTAAP